MVLKGVNGLEEAQKDQISFAVPPYLEVAGQSRAGAIMIPRGAEFRGEQAVLAVENPRPLLRCCSRCSVRRKR